MRPKRVYITLRGSLDDDVNRFLGQSVCKDIGNIVCWVKLCY